MGVPGEYPDSPVFCSIVSSCLSQNRSLRPNQDFITKDWELAHIPICLHLRDPSNYCSHSQNPSFLSTDSDIFCFFGEVTSISMISRVRWVAFSSPICRDRSLSLHSTLIYRLWIIRVLLQTTTVALRWPNQKRFCKWLAHPPDHHIIARNRLDQQGRIENIQSWRLLRRENVDCLGGNSSCFKTFSRVFHYLVICWYHLSEIRPLTIAGLFHIWKDFSRDLFFELFRCLRLEYNILFLISIVFLSCHIIDGRIYSRHMQIQGPFVLQSRDLKLIQRSRKYNKINIYQN
jgi:hypothetical protein